MTIRGRFSEWLHPTLLVPTLGEPEATRTGDLPTAAMPPSRTEAPGDANAGSPRGGARPDTQRSRSRLLSGAAMESTVPGSPSAGLAHLFGRKDGVRVVVVSPRGVEIPINAAPGWTAVDVASVLSEIDALPEAQ